MLKTFTEQEMLDYWKRRLGLASSPGVEGTGYDNRLDLKLTDDIRAWYADLLHTAPRHLLPVEDLGDEISARLSGDNCLEITIPERGIRFVSLKLADWPARVDFTYPPEGIHARMQLDSTTRATPDRPVVVGCHHRLMAYGLPSGMPGAESGAAKAPPFRPLPEIDLLEMVAAPADGTYRLDEALLLTAQLPIR